MMNDADTPLKAITIPWDGKELHLRYRKATSYRGVTDYVLFHKTGSKILSYFHQTKSWCHLPFGMALLPAEFVKVVGDQIAKNEGWWNE